MIIFERFLHPMMKILAIATAYHPDTELMKKSISSYIGGVDRLLIWRNSPIDEKEFEALAGGGKIEFCGDCSNAGIPKALNYAWHYASEHGFSHLLTMDQDSVWENFEGYLAAALDPSAPEGIFGPRINGTMGEEKSIPFLLTSGMLVRVSLLDRIGGWNERLFVDGVDMEFVFRAREAGIYTYRIAECNLIHRLGNTVKKKFLGRTYTVNNYSPERLYGLYRSHIMIIRKYKSASELLGPVFRKQNYRQRPIRILLGEKHRFAKFAAIIRGIRDGRRDTL